MDNSISSAVRVLKAVKGYTLTGISNSAIASLFNDTPPNLSRALKTLIDEGLVVKLDNGLFAHSIEMLRIAQAHAEHINTIQDRITATNSKRRVKSLYFNAG